MHVGAERATTCRCQPLSNRVATSKSWGIFTRVHNLHVIKYNIFTAHYRDAITNRKAKVHLLVHETSGGMSPYCARRLRRPARDAEENGHDTTDYTLSYKARSFVPYHSQRMSSAIVMLGAQGILSGIQKMRADRLRRATRD